MIYFYILLIIAKIMDFYSTIKLDVSMEENPIAKYFWETYGNIGLALFDLVFIILMIGLVFITVKFVPKSKGIFAGVLFILSIFIILVALANMGNLVAYELTSYILGN